MVVETKIRWNGWRIARWTAGALLLLTPLAMMQVSSEWNWGADKTMNGALALADVLGILGREDVYLANYWRYPEPQSPGFFAQRCVLAGQSALLLQAGGASHDCETQVCSDGMPLRCTRSNASRRGQAL